MKISSKREVLEKAIGKLLSAAESIADKGNAKGVIQVTKFALHLADQLGDVFIQTDSEGNQQRSDNPINHL